LALWLQGGKNIHILVNNTGGPSGGPIADAKTDDFEKTFRQHLICNHILAQAFLPGMKESGYGRIINIISTSVKQPLKGLGVSNTIRAAVANWSKTLATEIAATGVTVNNVLPGATATKRLSTLIEAKSLKTGKAAIDLEKEMLDEIPMGRFAHPSEIAAAVAFLASPAASYITGINIPVDGGRTGSL
jgi:3-oxoacyl-[acyl-carrier protein] reductase